VNDGIEGRATLSASADKNGWAVLEEKVFSAADRTVEFKFAGMQAKYVKLELALSKGGIIRNLQFFGAATDKGYAVKQSADGKEGKPMDLINGLGGARVVYAAPKPANGLDTAITYNQFAFPESDEKYRTIIYDFGQLRILNEFASVHSPRPVRFEVFAFDNLPEKEDWRGRMAFDPSDFNNAKPVAVAEDTRGTGNLKAKPAKAVKTRYLAMRWEPEFNPPDFQCYAGAEGMGIVATTNTIVVTNTDGTKSVITVTVGDAHAAGASDSKVSPDNAAQQIAQGEAASSDTTVITVATYPAGTTDFKNTTPTSTTTTTGTSTVSVTTSGNTTVTTSTTKVVDSSGNIITTTIKETNTNGTITTEVGQTTTTTDSNGQTTTTNNTDITSPGTNSTSTTGTSGDGNLAGGNTPSPATVTPGAPASSGGTQVSITSP